MFDATGIEGACSPDDAVHIVSFLEEELGEVRSVLAGDASDERARWHHSRNISCIHRFSHRTIYRKSRSLRNANWLIYVVLYNRGV